MKIRKYYFIVFLIPILYSCQVYKSNIMFKTEYEQVVDSIRIANKLEDKNYVIAPNDYIGIKVYTNNGERIIDPDYELMKGVTLNTQQGIQEVRYLVRDNGYVFLPMIGDIKLLNLTVRQADSVLSKEYGKYYYNVFVNTKILNKRIVVIGAIGGKVIPLENDNISIVEAIAIYGGLSADSRAKNIRLIRGDLKNPDVSIMDLSTIDGMKKAITNVEPNDIIYIEPVRRIVPQAMQDILPVLSLITSIVTTFLLIANLNKQ